MIARAQHEEALRIYKALSDAAGIITAINALAACETLQGNLEAARGLWDECVKLSQEAGGGTRTLRAACPYVRSGKPLLSGRL